MFFTFCHHKGRGASMVCPLRPPLPVPLPVGTLLSSAIARKTRRKYARLSVEGKRCHMRCCIQREAQTTDKSTTQSSVASDARGRTWARDDDGAKVLFCGLKRRCDQTGSFVFLATLHYAPPSRAIVLLDRRPCGVPGRPRRTAPRPKGLRVVPRAVIHHETESNPCPFPPAHPERQTQFSCYFSIR